ncbi:MAG: DEAD/DEAH box helicase [Deltaproteobacteria bacterium]|jgi:superfamily II DNA or RNA helicase|nr:DEAD/DEAH box helicase [Deltaproteobacteria bacterium]MBW2532227.1 DEAD/DEAH box helicase [Deltaproteobacteria bacterium]
MVARYRIRKPRRLRWLGAEEREAFYELCQRAWNRSGPLPVELLAEQVLRATAGADWAVKRAALDALLRRLGAVRREKLAPSRTALRSSPLGTYVLQRKAPGAEVEQPPYTTVLYGVDPPRGSCSCPDFLRSSLGLCKHLLAVLIQLYTKEGALRDALFVQVEHVDDPQPLRWDPIRPLKGRGDWLARVYWHEPRRGRRLGRRSTAELRARQWLDAAGRLGWRHLRTATRRLEIVEDLSSALAQPSARPDPALVALLEQESERFDRLFQVTTLASRSATWQRGLRRQLYPFQVEGVRRFLETGRLLLADDMGLGKTVQAIAACHALVRHERARRGLIIAPASLKPQWLREWAQTTDVPAAIVDGGPTRRARQYESHDEGFLILNYEQLWRDLPLLLERLPEVVVIDEAQRIKNWATKTAACVKALTAPYRLALTGTPMENRLEELASIYEWIDDMALEPKWRLSPQHLWVVGDGHRSVGGARDLDTLRLRLASGMVRRARSDVLDDLPPRTDVRVPIVPTVRQRILHDELNEPIAQLAAMGKRRPLSPQQFARFMSLLTAQRLISNGVAQYRFDLFWPLCERSPRPTSALRTALEAPKLEELRRLVRSLAIDQGRKILIFSQWRRMLRLARWALSDLLDDAGLRAVFFTGAESPKLRQQAIVEFHDEPLTRLMLLTDAGGVGLNLQRAASCCINLELPWNPAVLEQRIGRIYRLGQRRPIDVFNLVTEGGIESRIATIVAVKQALFTSLFDDGCEEMSFEVVGTMFEQIERLVDPEALAEAERASGAPRQLPLPRHARATGVAPSA